MDQKIDSLKGVRKTVQGLQSQGVPKQQIVDRIKFAAKGVDAAKVVDRISSDAEDRKREAALKSQKKKKDAHLKNTARKLEKGMNKRRFEL